MHFGDLYALDAGINSRYGHCVPVDAAIKDLRVSYVFRCVTKNFVHPTKRYYREMDKTGRHTPLPEPEAEPIGTDDGTTSSDSDDEHAPTKRGHK